MKQEELNAKAQSGEEEEQEQLDARTQFVEEDDQDDEILEQGELTARAQSGSVEEQDDHIDEISPKRINATEEPYSIWSQPR